jgi:hypothetical protein
MRILRLQQGAMKNEGCHVNDLPSTKRGQTPSPETTREGLGRSSRQWNKNQGLMQTEPPQPPSIPPCQGGGQARFPGHAHAIRNLRKPEAANLSGKHCFDISSSSSRPFQPEKNGKSKSLFFCRLLIPAS